MKNTKQSSTLTLEGLSKMWGTDLKNETNTIVETTHQRIRTTGLLSNRFMTDKAHLWYNHLSCSYATFYVEYLKVGVKYIRQFISSNLYTNKIGFNKLLPCTNETYE